MKAASPLHLALLASAGLHLPCHAGPESGNPAPNRSETIADVRLVHRLTGETASVDTLRKWRIGGTDLGFPIYNHTTGRMHLAFGDTFLNPVDMTGQWRSNVMAESGDFDLRDGLALEDVRKDRSGEAVAVIEGHHSAAAGEITKIPTGGIEVDGVLYLFFMSVKAWGSHGNWIVNYNGVVKSGDNGATWERLDDLTWLCQEEGDNGQALKLANQTVSLSDSGADLTRDGRFAPSFAQIFPVDGKDGHVYLYGMPQGRSGGAKLARVKRDLIGDFGAYEYCHEIRAGEPVFVKGRAGLQELESKSCHHVIPAPCSEISVAYNGHLKRWMTSYFMNGSIVYRTADQPWGPWSGPETVITSRDYPALYGGMIHEKYSRDQGRTFYLILSQWMPVYNTSLIEVSFK